MPSLQRQALGLSLFTVAYNLAEGGIAIFAAQQSGSHALLGFGLDSFIESLSGSVMIWRFWRFAVDDQAEAFERVERRAARLVAYSFFALGAYVVVDAGLALIRQEAPATSRIGLLLAVASLLVMPLLFLAKYRIARRIGSRSLIADAKETLACLLLSIALLIGLGANFLWQLWWIDSAAALVIAALVIHEGWETLEEAEEENGEHEETAENANR